MSDRASVSEEARPGTPASAGNASDVRPKAAVIFPVLVIFLDMMGVGLIAPITPYVIEIVPGEFSKSGSAVAVLTLAYSAAQFLATPVLGTLSDRFGRRPVLVLSILGSALGYVVFALAGMFAGTLGAAALGVMMASRVLDGFTGGNISTAQACIADVTAPKDRSKAYGLVGAAFGLGFTLGPTFGALVSPLSPLAPVWAAAGLSVLTACFVYFRLPETLAPERRTHGTVRVQDLNPLATMLRVLRMHGLAVLLGVIFLLNFAHAELRTSFGIMLRDKLQFKQSATDWMFAYLGLMAIIVQGGLLRRVAPKLGDRRTALVGLPIAVVGYGLLPHATNAWGIVGAITLMAIGGGLAGPTITGILSRSVDVKQQGTVMGASQAASALALMTGPIIAGVLYDHVGWSWPFWSASLVVLLGFLLFAAKVHGRPHEPQHDIEDASAEPGAPAV